MKKDKEEYQTYVVKLVKEKNYGFVYSEYDRTSYHFKIKACKYDLSINDRVSFLGEQVGEKRNASAIRKIYINASGIKIIPRVNF